MDSRHTSALPQAAWRPSLLPPAGATPRHGQAEPVRLLAALRQDAAPPPGAAAVSGLQSCLASLAALAFAGLGAALLLHWSPSDGTLDVQPSHGAVPAAWEEPAAATDAPALAHAGAVMPAPAAARIERLAAPRAEAVVATPAPASATPAPAAITPAAGARTVNARAAATPHPARHATAPRHRDGPAAAARPASGQAPAPSTRAPLSDGEGAAAPPTDDPDAALLQAVMELHEQHAPPSAPRR